MSLIEKKDGNSRLIWWVFFLLEFESEVKDRKGTKNQVANHLSKLEEKAMLIFIMVSWSEGIGCISMFDFMDHWLC